MPRFAVPPRKVQEVPSTSAAACFVRNQLRRAWHILVWPPVLVIIYGSQLCESVRAILELQNLSVFSRQLEWGLKRCGKPFFFKGVAIVLLYSEAQKPGPSLSPLVFLNFWSLGPLFPVSSGPSVLWSLVLWCLAPLVPWSCGPLVLWSLGPLVPWS